MIAEKKMQAGVIYGDNENNEYVYLPASEIGSAKPLYVYEADGSKEDIDIEEALRLITTRSLRPVKHPVLGSSTC